MTARTRKWLLVLATLLYVLWLAWWATQPMATAPNTNAEGERLQHTDQ